MIRRNAASHDIGRFAITSLAVGGLVLLALGAVFLIPILRGLNDEDVRAALTPLTRIPLAQVEGTVSSTLKLLVPDAPQWTRIRREWGNPEFIVSAISSTKQFAYCLGDLDIGIQIYQHGGQVPVEVSYPPYGYSTDCSRSSLRFQAVPGSELEIRVSRSGQSSLPSGELIIVAYWPDTKDKLVGRSLDRQLRPAATSVTGLGAALITLAVYLQRRRVFNKG
jgi:hypothetical protein